MPKALISLLSPLLPLAPKGQMEAREGSLPPLLGSELWGKDIFLTDTLSYLQKLPGDYETMRGAHHPLPRALWRLTLSAVYKTLHWGGSIV